MKACICVSRRNNEWIRDIFPGKSPAEMPIVGKGWVRHAVDFCCLLKIPEAFIADSFFYPDLPKRLGDGSFWSMKIEYRQGSDAVSPKAFFEQQPEAAAPDDELLIFWGQVLPDVEDAQRVFDRLTPVTENADEVLPDGVYLRRGGVLHRCECPLHRMDSVKNYFELNMRLLKDPGIYNPTGYSSERGVYIGGNVITMFGCDLKPPLLLQDNCCVGRSVLLDGEVIIGSNVLVDDFSQLKRTLVLGNTYIGRHMYIENKIVAGHTVIDVETGVHVELSDHFLVGDSGRHALNRFTVTEFLLALMLLVLLLPWYLLGLAFRKWLSPRPFFNYVLKIYPKLPQVLTGHASLVRNGMTDNSYVFRLADRWILVSDENYRNFADVFFCTNRSIRLILAVVTISLVKRFVILSEPRRRDGGGVPKL